MLDRFRLDGRVAVVTGGAKGIGWAISEALSAAGAKIEIADIDADAAAEAAGQLQSIDREANGTQLDITDSNAVDRFCDQVADRHGAIDILVNNAGIGKSFLPAESMKDTDWLTTMDVNLNGLFWCSRAFGRKMLERGSGTIVNIGSMSGEIANRPQEQAQYNASKAAVHHLTRSLAAEWGGRGLRVNAVAPTYIETDLTSHFAEKPELQQYWIGGTPIGRMGRADEVAAVVLFLASDAASLINGSVVLADGGYTCW